MNLTNGEAICLSIYVMLQVMTFCVLIKEGFDYPYEHTYRTILDYCFVNPYRRGIKLGNLIGIVFFAPGILASLLVSGFFPVLLDVILYVVEIKITKPRPRK